MRRKKFISVSIGGAPGLLGLVALLTPCPPASAQTNSNPCGLITAACQAAGFVYGSTGAGNGLILDCIRPIMQNKPQPATAKLPLPTVAPQVVGACKASNPDFGMTQAQPQSAAPAPPPPPVESGPGGGEEFSWNDNTYGWYDDGWNGPGWYIVGYELRRGLGFGGREGWHNWRHLAQLAP